MNIVSIDWLEKNLENSEVIILDCSWHLPNTNRSGNQEFLKERIPSAIFFDIDEICDKKSPYPHMIPDENYFSQKVSELGILNIIENIVANIGAAKLIVMASAMGKNFNPR